uniref:Major facilitator superfamily (MFS) profile domain-containing protein n=1 Tax=Photinus pyralis TaxID=7054 RepID=A0A1Y1N4L4_PHOPY
MYAYRYQIFASLSATVSEISDGMQYGWSAPITALLLSARSPFPFKESDVVWVEISLLFGTLIGIPITVVLLESLGRKTSILVATAQNLLAWVLIAFANSAGVVYAARFLSGIAASVVFAAAPVYTAEIADKKIRGFLGSFFLPHDDWWHSAGV